MLAKRIFSSTVLVALILSTIYIDWMLGLLATAFIVFGLYEYFTMLEQKGILIYKYVGIGIGALIPLSIIYRFEPTKSWELLFIVLVLLSLILMQFRRRQSSGAVVGISTTIFGILYISWFFSFLIKIRMMQNGAWLLATVLIITKLGDVGAYFIGSRFGKVPLMPRISPKKTVEGAIGGLVFSVIGALLCRPFLPVGEISIIFMGIFLGILGQLGDLSESLMKRDCGVKDSGNLLPGMGGVLDLMDSMIFTAPAFYFYMSSILK